jgi:tetratricopeptide (TPR) repeat protein
MMYLRESGLKIFLIMMVLIALSPSALEQPFTQPINQAISALEQQRVTQALNAIEDALLFEPNITRLHESALDLALRLGQWERAESHLNSLKASGASSPRIACAQAQLQLIQGVEPEYIEEELLAASSCPGILDLLHERAMESFQAGDFKRAVPLLENLIAIGVADNNERTSLALFSAATDPLEALDQLREAQSIEGPQADLALSLLITIQDNQALDTPAYLYAQVGQTFSRVSEWHLVHETFRNAVKIDPEYAQAWGYLGVAKDNVGQDGESELLEAVRLSPEDPFLLVLLAVHYNRKGDAEGALPILERAFTLDPENPAIAVEFGQAYTTLGDLENARLAFRQATLLAPDEAAFWYLLANFSLRHELEIEAIGLPSARNALILQADSSQGWQVLGYAHYLLGNFSLAQRALHRAIEISPTDPTTQYYLGLTYQAQARTQEAISAWRMAMKISTEHPSAQLAQRALETLGYDQ